MGRNTVFLKGEHSNPYMYCVVHGPRHAKSYFDHLSPDLLVDNHTHCSLSNIVHPPRLPMVELVGHTLVESTVTLNVNNVPNLVHLHVRGQMFHP